MWCTRAAASPGAVLGHIGYPPPAAATCYLSTRNKLIDGEDEGDDGIEERIFSDHHLSKE